ncbi:MAG: DUF6603 domain-containing protein [bacterium]
MSDVFSALGTTLDELLYPLERAAVFPGALSQTLARLGVPVESSTPALVNAISSLDDLRTEIALVAAEDSPSLDDIVRLLQTSEKAFTALTQIDSAGGPLAQLPGVTSELVQWLVTSWLQTHHPITHEILVLLTLIELEADQPVPPVQMQGTEVSRYSYRIERLHLDRIGQLLRDPVSVLRAAYMTPLLTSADADKMADALFTRLMTLFRALGVSCRYGINPGDDVLLGDSAQYMSRALIVYFTDPLLTDVRPEAGVVLSLSPADRGDLGLVVRPFGTLTTKGSIGPFTVDASLTAGVDAFAVGRHGFTIASASSVNVSAKVNALLGFFQNDGGFVLGSPTGTRLALGGVSLGAEAELSAAKRRFALSADVLSSSLAIAAGDGDGFLADVLPADGIRVDFFMGLTWDSDTGLHFRGSADLEATLPVGLAIGPVTLSAVHLGLRANADGSVETEVSANAGLSLGPVKANIERMGLLAKATFPSSGGNLGPAHLAFGFKSPSGVALSVDAQGVLTGGGFLRFDPAQGSYAGVMQLSLHDSITLTAYGLIATKLPDGSKGFSLLIFITADGFQPIPLGFGIVLQSLGGMLGVNRTFDQAVLAAGLKSDTLATLLFPRDPVANAPALLQALATAFPAKRGSVLLGLLARLTWFTPTLVTLDLALILEIGARSRLLILGRVSALLPARDNDLIRLNLDTLGVLDFGAGSLEADAVLVDSRLVHQFPVTGAAAVRAHWGNASSVPGAAVESVSTFVLAVGGLNPRFAAPVGFPTLERVAIALCSGNNPRLVCDAYFALTANTVQFGARASFYAEALGFSVSGDIGFDALVTLLPPHFIVDFRAAMQLKRGSHNLFQVTVTGTLEGPIPLHIAAKAKFEILWFSFTVHFDFTLVGGNTAQPVLPAVSVETAVAAALADPANWRTRRPAGVAHGVALRALSPSAGQVLDPLGQLVVTQQVAPLNTQQDVTTFGGAPVAGARRFALTGQLNTQAGTPVTAAFAPARYFDMSDDAKLTAPSFQTMDAGLVLGDATTHYDAATLVPAPLVYETITLAPLPSAGLPAAPAVAPATYALPPAALTVQVASGAAARAPVRRVGRTRFWPDGGTPAATLLAPRWQIVNALHGTPAPAAATDPTWSASRDQLDVLNRGGAQWLLVPEHEALA